MTINLFAPGNRATSITAIAVIAVAAALGGSATPASAAHGQATPVLAQGVGMGAHPSTEVREVQRALRRRGYDLGPPGVDGRFGSLTAAAVRRMQADYGLAVDGTVGYDTRHALGLARRVSTQPPSPAEHRSKAGHASRPTAGHDHHRHATTSRASARPASPAFSWSAGNSFNGALTGALATLGALLSAIAVAAVRHRRGGAQTTRMVRPPRVAEERSAPACPPKADCPPPGLWPGNPVIGYVTVSADQGANDDDRALTAIAARCEREGWNLLEIVRDREVGPTLERPALGYALKRIADQKAVGLVVSDLRRLSRSMVDLGALIAWFRDARATLVALDLDLDTSTPQGHRVGSALIALSTRQHARITKRTRHDVAGALNGDRANGRPAVRHDPELLECIAAMRAANMTLQAIADRLNADDVPTLRGGTKWRPSSIQSALGYRRPAPRDHLPPVTQPRADA
jgi:DNA invertase Pin-like site-specific DNA recombinase/peptidoglycan hydrolase-like protein with peptidoglycan-binding domain